MLFHILNKSKFEAIFRHPGLIIFYVTPAFDLNTLLYDHGGLFSANDELLLWESVRILLPGIGMYISFNFVASKEYGDWFDV